MQDEEESSSFCRHGCNKW